MIGKFFYRKIMSKLIKSDYVRKSTFEISISHKNNFILNSKLLIKNEWKRLVKCIATYRFM